MDYARSFFVHPIPFPQFRDPGVGPALCGAFRLQGKEVIYRQSLIQTSNLEHRVYVLRKRASEVISHFLLVLTAISCRDSLFAVCPDFSTICRTASEIRCKFVHTNSALS